MALSKQDLIILSCLSEDGGFTTRHVALKTRGVGRHLSAMCRQSILSLQKQNLVTTLDDEKPVCWKRTPEGTKAVEQAILLGHIDPWQE